MTQHTHPPRPPPFTFQKGLPLFHPKQMHAYWEQDIMTDLTEDPLDAERRAQRRHFMERLQHWRASQPQLRRNFDGLNALQLLDVAAQVLEDMRTADLYRSRVEGALDLAPAIRKFLKEHHEL